MDYLLIQDNSNSESFEETEDRFSFSYHTVFLEGHGSEQKVFHTGYSSENTYILPNAQDQAYVQVIPNDDLINAINDGLLKKIPLGISRIIVWRGLVSLTSKGVIPSSTLFEIVIQNIVEEEDIHILDAMLPTLSACASGYLPTEKYSDIGSRLFLRMYEKILSLSKINEENGTNYHTDRINILISTIIHFIFDEESVQIATQWILKGGITDQEGSILKDNEPKTNNNPNQIQTNHRYKIIRKIFEYPCIEFEVKKKILQREFELNHNDQTIELQIKGDASLPSLENKQKIWERITNPQKYKLSSYEYTAYITGFFS